MTHIAPLTWAQICAARPQGPTYYASAWTDTDTEEGEAVSTNLGWIFSSRNGVSARIIDPGYLVLHGEVGDPRRQEQV